MVFDARLRSHTPISHSEFNPRSASVCHSSSGISSSRAMRRPYCLLSCASHTYVLFAISTVLGIHAVSGLNFSYSYAGSPNTGTSDLLTIEGHCCSPRSRRRRAAASAVSRAFCASGVELHPDRQLFLAQHLARHHKKRSSESPSSPFHNLRISASCSLSDFGAPAAGARSSSNRFTRAPSTGISGRVAKYVGSSFVTC